MARLCSLQVWEGVQVTLQATRERAESALDEQRQGVLVFKCTEGGGGRLQLTDR